MPSRARECAAGVGKARLAKAEQFFSASESVTIVADGQSQMADAGVSLLILCGIAASDVILLLALKTKANYSHIAMSTNALKRASRAAEALLIVARTLA